MKISKENRLPIITIALGTLFQLFFLFRVGFIYLLNNTIHDDSFYYFQVARNIVNGCGSTMDCVNISNGYHPLWMIFLLPIYKFFSVGGVYDINPIYISLCLAIIFSAITSFFIYLILKNYTSNSKIISFALLIYLFNPYLIYHVLNGLETSLVLMLIAGFIYVLVKYTRTIPSNTNLINVGIFGGLLTLARLDMTIVVFITNLFFIYKYGKKGINYFFVSGLTVAIIFLSWMIYNFKMFGMYLTSASVTSTFINHRLTYIDNGGESLKVFIKTVVYMMERATQQIVSDTGAPIMILMLFGLSIFFAFKNKIYEKITNRDISPEFFVAFGLFVLVFVSAGLRWTFRGWYFIPLLVIWTFVITWTIENIFKELEISNNKFIQNIFFGLLIIFFAFSFFVSWNKNLDGDQTLAYTFYQGTLWMNDNLPANAKIGAFNSGIQTYFSNHRVTNLDGLINNNASTAMLNNTLWQYITQTEHLDYIADFDSYMTYRYKDSFRDANGNLIDPTSSTTMEKIYTIHGPKDLNIYKIKY